MPFAHKKYALFSLSLLFIVIASGQNLSLKGKIIDAMNGNPLPFASISLNEGKSGVCSNIKGEFQLVLNAKYSKDSLRISFVGYAIKKLSIQDAMNTKQIELNPIVTDLQRVEIKTLTAKSVLNKAIENIPKNYFSEAHQSRGFYRVNSKKDKEYVHLSEAVFDLYRSKSKRDNQFKLVKMRALKDEKSSHGIELGLRPKSIYEFDVLADINSFDVFSKKGLKDLNLSIAGSKWLDGHEVYEIHFQQKPGLKRHGYKGKVLIDKENFAILKLDFGLDPKTAHLFKYGDRALRTLMSILGIDIEMSRNDVQIQYKKIGEKYFLSNVGNDATLHMRSKREHYNFSVDTRVDYIVTETLPDSSRAFSSDEILRGSKLIENQSSIYDSAFWDDHSILLSIHKFNEIADKINAKNEANYTRRTVSQRIRKLPKDVPLRLDSILTFYNKSGLFNGTALVAKGSETMLHKSFNNVVTENEVDATYRIGSTSKTFTSMLIMLLEEKGDLKLDDKISKYLPDFIHGEVTIEQLLTHTSGIPELLGSNEYMTKILTESFELDELVTNFCSDPLEFESGSEFEYSNSGYIILAGIVETVTGLEFSAALEQMIFEPLEMNDSAAGSSKYPERMVTSYLYGAPEVSYDLKNVIGAGGITTTSSDLLKWSNSFEANLLLNESGKNELWIHRSAYKDWDASYGYGWIIDVDRFWTSKKHDIVYHPGTDLGFYTMFLKQPDKDITIILLNNTGEFPRFEISDLILDQLN